jgi:hypothetical protein
MNTNGFEFTVKLVRPDDVLIVHGCSSYREAHAVWVTAASPEGQRRGFACELFDFEGRCLLSTDSLGDLPEELPAPGSYRMSWVGKGGNEQLRLELIALATAGDTGPSA